MVSVVVHAGIVGALVVATAQATVAHVAEERETRVKFTNTTPPPPPPPAATREVFTATPVAKGLTVMQTPIDIPTSLPSIDVNAPPTNLDNFTGIGKPGGRADGVEGATGVARALNDVFSKARSKSPWRCFQGA